MGDVREVLVGEVLQGRAVPLDIQSLRNVPLSQLPPEQHAEVARIGRAALQKRQDAKRLSELEAWKAEHREHAAELFQGKLQIIQGLFRDATVTITNPETGETENRLEPSILGDKKLKVLLNYIEQFEKAGFKLEAAAANAANPTVNVNVLVANLQKELA